MALRLNGSTSGYVGIDAPATAASNTLVLPNGNGSNGQALTTNGSGTLSWTTITGSQWTTSGSDINYTAGRVLVGSSTAIAGKQSQQRTLQIAKAQSSTNQGVSVFHFDSGGQPPNLELGLSKNNTLGSHTVVSNGDNCGSIKWSGSDGTGFVELAAINGVCDGTPGTNDMPGRLVFATTADGASSPTERMRITNGGYLKASNTGNYQDAGGTYHEFLQSLSGNSLVNFRHTASSSPFGIIIKYSAASPNDTGSPFWQCNDSTTTRGELRSNGGLANYSGNNVNLSDINAKKDISPAVGTWDCIKEWEIVNYRYKDQPDDADLNLGVIAQQVAESCPEVITVFSEAKEAKAAVLDDDGNEIEAAQEAQPEKLGVKEQQMYWMAIKALQEAMERIETLEAANASLEARLTALEVTP